MHGGIQQYEVRPVAVIADFIHDIRLEEFSGLVNEVLCELDFEAALDWKPSKLSSRSRSLILSSASRSWRVRCMRPPQRGLALASDVRIPGKGDLRPEKGWSETESFCLTVAFRNCCRPHRRAGWRTCCTACDAAASRCWVFRPIVPIDSGPSCPAIPAYRAHSFRSIAPSLRA
jgi:hypothetical protein